MKAGLGKAVVLGASMAGLAAAAALRRRFERVIVVDRDVLPDRAEPRQGVGQSSHVHNLLKGGEESIEALVPGVRRRLVEGGAAELKNASDVLFFDHGHWMPRRDLGYVNLAASRPLIELVTRRAIAEFAEVRFLDCTTFTSLHWTGDRVAGANIRSGGRETTLEAELVVDCTGQGTRLPHWLAEHGFGIVPTLSMNIGMSYTSGFFRVPDRISKQYRGMVVFPSAPLRRGCFAAQIEEDRWQISLATRFERELPKTHDEMITFAEEIEVPNMADLLRVAEPIGGVFSYRKPTATWRRYDKLRVMPKGILVLGDAIASFNPIFAQGMSVAWLQARALAALLEGWPRTESLDDLAPRYFPLAMNFSREAWTACSVEDSAYAEVSGDRPYGTDARNAYVEAIRRLLVNDPELHRDYVGVSQLTSPVSALMRPDRAARIRAMLSEMRSEVAWKDKLGLVK